jgi:transcriptional regulator with XRE-family HTH domain
MGRTKKTEEHERRVPGFKPQELRRIREAQQLLLWRMAARTGLSLNTLTNYEHGHTEPNLANVLVLARALGVHPVRLHDAFCFNWC